MEITNETFITRAKKVANRVFRHENGVLLIILIALVAVLGIMTHGLTVSKGNITNILVQSSTRGIAAIGQLFVILTAGIDLSVGGVALFAGVLGAKLMSGTVGFPTSVIALMFIVPIGVGAASGALVSRAYIPALIATLGMWRILDGGAYMINDGSTIRNLPDSINQFGTGVIGGVPVPVIFFIVIAVIAYFILNHTTFGRSIYATGGNPVSAWLSGVNTKRVIHMSYIISGFLAGVAGLILMSRVMCGSMTLGTGLEMDSIAAVCVGGVSLSGGRGSLIGAVIGVIIIGVINNGMNVFALNPALQDITKGAIIIAAVWVDQIRRRR